MSKIGDRVTNIYGSVIVAITTLRVHIFEGEDVFNLTTGKFVNAPALGAGGGFQSKAEIVQRPKAPAVLSGRFFCR